MSQLDSSITNAEKGGSARGKSSGGAILPKLSRQSSRSKFPLSGQASMNNNNSKKQSRHHLSVENKHGQQNSTHNQQQIQTPSHIHLPQEQKTHPAISLASLRRPRSQSDLKSARQALQYANTSKAVRLEATQVVYLKKIEGLQRQEWQLQREMANVKKQIEEMRLKKKMVCEQVSRTTVNTRCSSSKTSTNRLTKDGTGATELTRGQLQTLRRQIDKYTQKQQKTVTELDKVRREIFTIKKLNRQLQADLERWANTLQIEKTESEELEARVVRLTEEVRRRKVDEVRKQTGMIKQYQGILRRLESELANGSSTHKGTALETDNMYLPYLTEVPLELPKNPSSTAPTTKRTSIVNPLPSKRTTPTAILQQNISTWQQQLTLIQDTTSTRSIVQLQEKLAEQKEERYHQGKYLLQRYQLLEGLKDRNRQLRSRKAQMEQLYGEGRGEGREERARQELRVRMTKNEEVQHRYRKELQELTNMEERLMHFVETFRANSGKEISLSGSKLGHEYVDGEKESKNEGTLGEWLQAILTSLTTDNSHMAGSQSKSSRSHVRLANSID